MKKQPKVNGSTKRSSIQVRKLPWFSRHFYLYPMVLIVVVFLAANHLLKNMNIPYLLGQAITTSIPSPSVKVQLPTAISPAPIVENAELKLPKRKVTSLCQQDAWVYVKDGALYYACNAGQSVLIGASDGKDTGKWFEQPQFVSDDMISFQECSRRDFYDSSATPFTCYFVTYNLLTGVETQILKFQSRPNTSGYQMAENIKQYAWDQTHSRVAYVVENYDDITMDVILHDTQKQTTLKITSFPMFGGRETGPDDELKTTFSPDNTKLIVQTMSSIKDDSSHDAIVSKVIDLSADPPKVIWDRPQESTSNNRFVDSNQFLAKEIPLQRGQEGYLFRFDLRDGQEKMRIPANNWHQIDPIDDQTILFWQYDENYVPQVVKYDLERKQPLQIWDNLYLEGLLTNKKALVVKVQKCTDGGQTPDYCPISGAGATSVLDLETREISVAGIPEVVQYSYYQYLDYNPAE